MAIIQDDFTDDLAKGYAGMVASGETSNRISRTCEDAGGIAFGVPVYRGANDHTCTRTPSAGNFLGVTIAHEALGIVAGQDADTYAEFENVAIMTEGAIYVTAGAAVTPGADAFDTGAAIGVTNTDTAMTGWAFDETGADGDIVRLAKR